ncbi:MAG TPA: hypothetical protein VKW04_11545, partial [Planctomycetota bacterium]|nr:hypothetical protein [Planctomycetota bacterium]
MRVVSSDSFPRRCLLSLPLLAALLMRQSAPDRWIKDLGSDRIEERAEAAARLKEEGRIFRDAARLWIMAAAGTDPVTRIRLARIRAAWVGTLGDDVAPFEVPPDETEVFPRDTEQEDPVIAAKLQATRFSLEVTNAPLPIVMSYLQEESGIHIDILGIADPDRVVLNFHSEREPLERLLSRVLRPRKLAAVVRKGVLVVCPRETAAWARLKLYVVADLIWDQSGEDLIERIVRDVRPGEWSDAGRSIQVIHDFLIVRASSSFHR